MNLGQVIINTRSGVPSRTCLYLLTILICLLCAWIQIHRSPLGQYSPQKWRSNASLLPLHTSQIVSSTHIFHSACRPLMQLSAVTHSSVTVSCVVKVATLSNLLTALSRDNGHLWMVTGLSMTGLSIMSTENPFCSSDKGFGKDYISKVWNWSA